MSKNGLGQQPGKSPVPVSALYCIKLNGKVKFYSVQQPQIWPCLQFIYRMFTHSNTLPKKQYPLAFDVSFWYNQISIYGCLLLLITRSICLLYDAFLMKKHFF